MCPQKHKTSLEQCIKKLLGLVASGRKEFEDASSFLYNPVIPHLGIYRCEIRITERNLHSHSPCSLQHQLQESRYRHNPNVQQMDKKKCGIHTQWNITQPLKRKYYHL
jgi:hypothetical protein